MINGLDKINYNCMNGTFDINVDNVNTSSITYDDDIINVGTDTNSLNIYGKNVSNSRNIHLYDNVIIENNLNVKGITNISLSGFIYGQMPTFSIQSNLLNYQQSPTVSINNSSLTNPIINLGLPASAQFYIGNVNTISGPAYVTQNTGYGAPNYIFLNFGIPCPYFSVNANTISSYIASVSIDNSNIYYPQMNFNIPQGLQGIQGIQGIQGQTPMFSVFSNTISSYIASSVYIDNSNIFYPQMTFNIPQGIQGIQGIQGYQGPQGANGSNGSNGKDGAGGGRGDKGDDGPDGPAGPAGSTGPTGSTGPAGDSIGATIGATIAAVAATGSVIAAVSCVSIVASAAIAATQAAASASVATINGEVCTELFERLEPRIAYISASAKFLEVKPPHPLTRIEGSVQVYEDYKSSVLLSGNPRDNSVFLNSLQCESYLYAYYIATKDRNSDINIGQGLFPNTNQVSTRNINIVTSNILNLIGNSQMNLNSLKIVIDAPEIIFNGKVTFNDEVTFNSHVTFNHGITNN